MICRCSLYIVGLTLQQRHLTRLYLQVLSFAIPVKLLLDKNLIVCLRLDDLKFMNNKYVSTTFFYCFTWNYQYRKTLNGIYYKKNEWPFTFWFNQIHARCNEIYWNWIYIRYIRHRMTDHWRKNAISLDSKHFKHLLLKEEIETYWWTFIAIRKRRNWK